MRSPIPRRLALWGGALALLIGPDLALAQDGQQEVEAPVTNPETNKLRPRVQTSTPPVRTDRSTLPGVPATANDPAPVGTRAVPAGRLQGPGRTTAPGEPLAPGAQVPPGTRAAAPGARRARPAASGIQYIEGVVTKLITPDAKKGELLRFAIDPSQDWFTYASEGPQGIDSNDRSDRADRNDAGAGADNAKVAEDKARVEKDKARLAEAKARDNPDEAEISGDEASLALDQARLKEDEAAAKDNHSADTRAAGPRPVELTYIRTSRIFTFARTPDGTDLIGAATESTPTAPSGRSVLGRTSAQPAGPKETNFTNIKEGSFVAVRYRKVGGRNEIVNASLIEFPLNAPTEAAPGTAPAAGGSPGSRRAPATPVRVPGIPAAPVGSNALPR